MITDRPAAADVKRADKPMRLAFVYCRNPLPMRRADQITVAHTIEFLSARGHAVDLFCFDGDGQGSKKEVLTPAEIAWLEEKCASVTHVHQSRSGAFLGALMALLLGKPLQVGWLSNRKLSNALATALNDTDYDLLYVYYFRSAETVLKGLKRTSTNARHVPTVLAMQLSQTLNTRRIRDNATNLATRSLFTLESWLVSRYEARVWRKFDRVALIGPKDVEAIEAECREQGLPIIDNWFYSPHGTDVARFRPRRDIVPTPGTVLFAGTLFYPPNIQAASWLAKSIWPLVRERMPSAQLRIVGRDPSPEVLALASNASGVEVVGSVPDLGEYMLRAAVCVNPVRAAGGMQNKLIEYLASGRPVVATTVANEGIGAPASVIRLADTERDFADRIVELLEDPEAAEAVGDRGRKFAQGEWSWEAHFMTLEANLRALTSTESANVE